ncbi:MAG: T9SS type A sorting domain-containing protein [Bacteroidota bacterium]
MKQKLLFLLITFIFSLSINAQFALGDIAFSAYGSDNTVANGGPIDAFTIVLLRNVSMGEEIAFTENGWFAAGGFRANESTATLTFGAAYTEGAQIVISSTPFEARDEVGNIAGTLTGSGLALATGGDQIFAYDPANVPSAGNESGFVAAIQMNGAWDADATSATTSAKPAVFTDGATSISISPEVDNARVSAANCGNFSDIASLRIMLNTASNWETDGSTAYDQSSPVCDFKQTLSTGEERLLTNAITVSPNPVEDRFSISLTNDVAIDKIEIYNITGQRVLTLEAYETNTPIDLSNMGSGIYLTKIFSGENTVVKKLIKK